MTLTSQSKEPDIQTLPFHTDEGIGTKARLGMIILQSDQTIEHEAAALIHDKTISHEVGLYHTRIPNEMEITEDTLEDMAAALPESAALMPSSFGFDAIGYGCTSGATIIGEARVDKLIKSVHPNAKTTNPITACKAALRALDITSLALITPYAISVTKSMQDNLQADGFAVKAVATFNQSDDFTVARITSHSLYEAVMAIGNRDDCEAVFISCTSLRALPIIAKAEEALNKPVLSSNQVFIWHLMRLAGLTTCPKGAGRLFEK